LIFPIFEFEINHYSKNRRIGVKVVIDFFHKQEEQVPETNTLFMCENLILFLLTLTWYGGECRGPEADLSVLSIDGQAAGFRG